MPSQSSRSNRPAHALAKPLEPLPEYRIARRVLTRELAEAFAAELLSDVSHSVSSAARAVGIKPATVWQALKRAQDDAAYSLQDEEICDLLAAAKDEHIRKIRGYGFVCAANNNRAGTSWMQWQSEVQDPLHHPRRQDVSLEMGGRDGGPIAVAGVQYVVMVPPDEPEEEP